MDLESLITRKVNLKVDKLVSVRYKPKVQSRGSVSLSSHLKHKQLKECGLGRLLVRHESPAEEVDSAEDSR